MSLNEEKSYIVVRVVKTLAPDINIVVFLTILNNDAPFKLIKEASLEVLQKDIHPHALNKMSIFQTINRPFRDNDTINSLGTLFDPEVAICITYHEI